MKNSISRLSLLTLVLAIALSFMTNTVHADDNAPENYLDKITDANGTIYYLVDTETVGNGITHYLYKIVVPGPNGGIIDSYFRWRETKIVDPNAPSTDNNEQDESDTPSYEKTYHFVDTILDANLSRRYVYRVDVIDSHNSKVAYSYFEWREIVDVVTDANGAALRYLYLIDVIGDDGSIVDSYFEWQGVETADLSPPPTDNNGQNVPAPPRSVKTYDLIDTITDAAGATREIYRVEVIGSNGLIIDSYLEERYPETVDPAEALLGDDAPPSNVKIPHLVSRVPGSAGGARYLYRFDVIAPNGSIVDSYFEWKDTLLEGSGPLPPEMIAPNPPPSDLPPPDNNEQNQSPPENNNPPPRNNNGRWSRPFF